MAIKKLVELDGEYGGWLEIDSVKLKRVATVFRDWLLTVDLSKDSFGFLEKDLPIVESALDGTMKLPFKGNIPHNWESREGLLPKDYCKIRAPFYNTIRGALYEPPEVIIKNGKYYAWTEFEDASSE